MFTINSLFNMTDEIVELLYQQKYDLGFFINLRFGDDDIIYYSNDCDSFERVSFAYSHYMVSNCTRPIFNVYFITPQHELHAMIMRCLNLERTLDNIIVSESQKLIMLEKSKQISIIHLLNIIHAQIIDSLSKNYLLLQGGGVLLNKKGILIIGPPGSGKSTLISYMVSKGFSYTSDELLLFDYDEKQIQAFPIPIGIRHKSLPILAGLRNIAQKGQRYQVLDEDRWIFDLRDYTIPKMSIHALIFCYVEPECKTTLQVLPKEDTISLLCRSSYNLIENDEKFFAICELAQRYKAYKLISKDVNESFALLTEMFE